MEQLGESAETRTTRIRTRASGGVVPVPTGLWRLVDCDLLKSTLRDAVTSSH